MQKAGTKVKRSMEKKTGANMVEYGKSAQAGVLDKYRKYDKIIKSTSSVYRLTRLLLHKSSVFI